MSRAIVGAVALGVGIGVLTIFSGGSLTAMLAVLGSTGSWLGPLTTGLILGGASMVAGSIAQALTASRGVPVTMRQPASARQIIRGEQRVAGIEIYRNTTGSKHDQFNYVIVLATHVVDSIVNLYLDGRQVHWAVGSNANTTRNGVNFGGYGDGNTYIGPNGAHYNFGKQVFCEARFGDQLEGDVIGSLTANDPNWAASAGGSPWCGGCCYVYLKIEYDTGLFPGEPEIRFTVRGKNDILDPRTGQRGYTKNWALHVADQLSDAQYGINDAAAVDQNQLIAAANVCDEQVTLASGQTESRFELHMYYDTSMSPGDVLQQMMPGAQGRLSRIGGMWFIWPSYWQGASFSFDQSSLLTAPEFNPVRSFRDLINRVTGTYTAPNFPYGVAGNLYDSNGWYDGTRADQFPYAFQPTNFPMYAADTLHGYASDEYLTEDGGVQLPNDLQLKYVLSVAQAQRCAKLMLMRNRQQGSATFTMGLAAWQMQPTDVFQMTFPQMTWTNKLFEVATTELKIEKPPKGEEEDSGEEDGALAIYVVVTATECDPSQYNWSTTEELKPTDVPGKLSFAPYEPVPPPDMTVTSSAATALTGIDGVVTPRALVSWDPPLDVKVTTIQVQYQQASVSPIGAWLDAGRTQVGTLQAFVTGLIAGQTYNFRIASVRADGSMSTWLEQDGLVMSMTLSTFANTAVQQVAPAGVLTEKSITGSNNINIVVAPFTATYGGSLSAACLPGGPYTIGPLANGILYWVYYIDPNFVGGNITPIATTNQSDYRGLSGYWLIGSIQT